MKSVAICLAESTILLKNVTDVPLLEAQILLAHCLQLSRPQLYTVPDSLLTEPQWLNFENLLKRRLTGEPIAYLVGTREFWSLPLKVTSAVLIPRPESELMVETVVQALDLPLENIKVADLGTGSGAIILAIAKERPQWECLGIDVSSAALEIARENAQSLHIKNIQFIHSHWCQDVPPVQFDVIVSNPPYLAQSEWPIYQKGLFFEPFNALVAGESGLEAIEEIVSTTAAFLKPQGYLLIEHGFLQGACVRAIFKKAGFHSISTLKDAAAQERLTMGCVRK